MNRVIAILLLSVYTISFGGYGFVSVIHEIAHATSASFHSHHHGHTHHVAEHSSILQLLKPGKASKDSMSVLSMVFLMDAVIQQKANHLQIYAYEPQQFIYVHFYQSIPLDTPSLPPMA